MTTTNQLDDFFDAALESEVFKNNTEQLNNNIEEFYEICDIVMYYSSVNEESEVKELAIALAELGAAMYPDTDEETHIELIFEEFSMSGNADVNKLFLDIIKASLPTAYQNTKTIDNLVNKCRAVRKAMFPNK